MEIHTLEPILKAHHFFQGLAPQHLQLLVGCTTNVRFNPGTYICRFGEDSNHFYLLRSGKVAIEVDCPGKGTIAIQTLSDNEIVGWSWLFPPYKWTFDVRATELTLALAMDAKCLRNKCDLDHDLGYELMKRFAAIMVDRLRAARLQLIDLYGPPKGTQK